MAYLCYNELCILLLPLAEMWNRFGRNMPYKHRIPPCFYHTSPPGMCSKYHNIEIEM